MNQEYSVHEADLSQELKDGFLIHSPDAVVSLPGTVSVLLQSETGTKTKHKGQTDVHQIIM